MNLFSDEDARAEVVRAKLAAFDRADKPSGKPKLDEIFAVVEQRVLKENGSAFANACIAGKISDGWARELVAWDATLRLLEAIRENQAAVFKVIAATKGKRR